jgi:hypothetical protein
MFAVGDADPDAGQDPFGVAPVGGLAAAVGAWPVDQPRGEGAPFVRGDRPRCQGLASFAVVNQIGGGVKVVGKGGDGGVEGRPTVGGAQPGAYDADGVAGRAGGNPEQCSGACGGTTGADLGEADGDRAAQQARGDLCDNTVPSTRSGDNYHRSSQTGGEVGSGGFDGGDGGVGDVADGVDRVGDGDGGGVGEGVPGQPVRV